MVLNLFLAEKWSYFVCFVATIWQCFCSLLIKRVLNYMRNPKLAHTALHVPTSCIIIFWYFSDFLWTDTISKIIKIVRSYVL